MQKHSFVLFILSWFNYNISAVFLLFYFTDDLVSEKNGETQNNITIDKILLLYYTNNSVIFMRIFALNKK